MQSQKEIRHIRTQANKNRIPKTKEKTSQTKCFFEKVNNIYIHCLKLMKNKKMGKGQIKNINSDIKDITTDYVDIKKYTNRDYR